MTYTCLLVALFKTGLLIFPGYESVFVQARAGKLRKRFTVLRFSCKSFV